MYLKECLIENVKGDVRAEIAYNFKNKRDSMF